MDNSPAPHPVPLSPSWYSQSTILHLAVLLILGMWLFGLEGGWLGGLEMGNLGLTDRDEGSNAEAAREMLETGDWISPTLNYEPRYAKPAFTYWLISGSYLLWGINEFAARFPSAVSGLCLIFLQYAFVRKWYGGRVAFLSSIMLLLNMEFLGINRMVLTDPELVVFTTMAGYAFWQGMQESRTTARWYFLVFYLGMGCAMLVKGPVGIIIPLMGAIPYLTLTRQWKTFWGKGIPVLGVALVVLVAAPWYVAMFQIHGDAYWAAAQANTTGRFMSPMEGHGGTLLFYIPILLVGFFPWSAFLPAKMYFTLKPWKTYWRGHPFSSRHDNLEFFLSLLVLGLLLFFTLSATRLPHYIYPLFPAAALLVARWWEEFMDGAKAQGLKLSVWLLLGVGYVLGIAIIMAPEVVRLFMKQITKEFPAAVHVELGWLPVFMGLVMVLGTMIMRTSMTSEKQRHLGVVAGSCMMIGIAFLGVKFAMPMFQEHFIGPPQQLAEIAKFNLGKDDRLLRAGRKLPSLSFYAHRKVYAFNPKSQEKWDRHLKAPGRKMVILQTPLRSVIPESVADWTVVLEHGGFSLLSSEPLLK